MTALLLLLAADAWTGFRGDGSGVSAAKNLPLEWTPKTLAWSAKLPGYGQSSPVIRSGKAFVTACDGPMKDKCLVLAFDLATGKELWRQELAATQKAKPDFSVSKAAPTPVVDGEGLTVFFESGELARFSLDGKQLWARSLVKEYGEFKNGHGLSASLAQTADGVLVLIDHQGPSYLLLASKKDGKNVWKVARKSRTSWTSPVVVGDKAVISSGGSVDVYSLKDGERLSTYGDLKSNNVPSAVVAGDRVVVGATLPQRGGGAEDSLKSCCCLALGKDGKLGEKPEWVSEKATASFASPLIAGEQAYYVGTPGVVFCLDLKTGKQLWAERTPSGACWAAPVAAMGKVWLFGKNGVVTVLEGGPKYKKVASSKTWEEPEAKPKDRFAGSTLYGVALADGTILMRTGTMLYAVRK
ncbi:MAG: PQQ-like beta-propeller repeat protein [Gemmataceae bacterium]|nr:PQQ-like beta-propeller repeat protein [Gemmataceae bacterium]